MTDPMAWLRKAAEVAPPPVRPPSRRTEPSPADHPMAWADDARCAGMDPELFHPVDDGGDAIDPRAVAACRLCPVRAQCLDWALQREPVGYWGGQTEKGRRRLRRTLGIVDPASLGRDCAADEMVGLTPPLSELDVGRSAAEVAAGVTPRTVQRHRAARRTA